jgi:hypothetical protein
VPGPHIHQDEANLLEHRIRILSLIRILPRDLASEVFPKLLFLDTDIAKLRASGFVTPVANAPLGVFHDVPLWTRVTRFRPWVTAC